MAIKRRTRKIKIEGEYYKITLDMNTIIEFKDNTDLNFLEVIENMKHSVDEYEIMVLCSFMLRKNNDPLGINYFKDFNPMFFITRLPYFYEIINLSMPVIDEMEDMGYFENNEIEDIDIDWYYFMARDILHMSEEEFLNSTPGKIYDLLKLYNKLSNKNKPKSEKQEITMKALPDTI